MHTESWECHGISGQLSSRPFSLSASHLTGLSVDRQNQGPFPYTSRGPLLLWESVWEWKRSGGGVYAWYGGRSVEGVKPDMTVEKQSRIKEAAMGQQLCNVLVFGIFFEFGSGLLFIFCVFFSCLFILLLFVPFYCLLRGVICLH